MLPFFGTQQSMLTPSELPLYHRPHVAPPIYPGTMGGLGTLDNSKLLAPVPGAPFPPYMPMYSVGSNPGAPPPPPYYGSANGMVAQPPTVPAATYHGGTTYYLPPSIPHSDSLIRQQQQPQLLPPVRMPPVAPNVSAAAPDPPKVTGGLCETLDYNVDEMSLFLADMSCDIMNVACHDTAKYNKFLSRILVATRLPRCTIMLSLVYLSNRCVDNNSKLLDESYHELMVVSLMLANKFHDDQTFTNKSWSETTGISVRDLTRLEAQWLRLVQWSLHMSESDTRAWRKWQACFALFVEKHQQKPLSPVSPAHTVSSSSPVTPSSPVPGYNGYQNNGLGITTNGNHAANYHHNDSHNHHHSYYVPCTCNMCVAVSLDAPRFFGGPAIAC